MPQKILSAVFWLTNVKFSIKRPFKEIYDSIVDVLKFMNLGVYSFQYLYFNHFSFSFVGIQSSFISHIARHVPSSTYKSTHERKRKTFRHIFILSLYLITQSYKSNAPPAKKMQEEHWRLYRSIYVLSPISYWITPAPCPTTAGTSSTGMAQQRYGMTTSFRFVGCLNFSV